jgi:hypothetical protein
VAKHHTENEIFQFITGDFRCLWDALAEKPKSEASNRGNFQFALLAAILLEWLCRLCESDPTATALTDFSRELNKIQEKYFVQLDHRVKTKRKLPSVAPVHPKETLLSTLWYLIRNGLAHLYQDILVESNGQKFSLRVMGVEHNCLLSKVEKNRASFEHLSYKRDSDGDLILVVHPGVLFLDIRDAAVGAKLLERSLKITNFHLAWDVSKIEAALSKNQFVMLT